MDETEVLERLLLDLYSHTDTSEENLHGDHDRLSAENLAKNIFSSISGDDISSSKTSNGRSKQLALLFTSESPPGLLTFIARLDEMKREGGKERLLDERDLMKAKVNIFNQFQMYVSPSFLHFQCIGSYPEGDWTVDKALSSCRDDLLC